MNKVLYWEQRTNKDWLAFNNEKLTGFILYVVNDQGLIKWVNKSFEPITNEYMTVEEAKHYAELDYLLGVRHEQKDPGFL